MTNLKQMGDFFRYQSTTGCMVEVDVSFHRMFQYGVYISIEAFNRRENGTLDPYTRHSIKTLVFPCDRPGLYVQRIAERIDPVVLEAAAAFEAGWTLDATRILSMAANPPAQEAPVTPPINLSHIEVQRQGDAIFIPLPRALWSGGIGGCQCGKCHGTGYWDTLAVAKDKSLSKYGQDTTWTVHYPELQPKSVLDALKTRSGG